MTHIHRIEVPIPYPVKWVNCYYIADSIPTLIDTGLNLPECFDALAKGILASGGDISRLRRVIATHGHTDHSGLAGRIRDISGAEVFIHCRDKNKLHNDDCDMKAAAFKRHLTDAGVPHRIAGEAANQIADRLRTQTTPVADAEKVRDGDIFSFDDFDLRVIDTPGHSPGSICLYGEDLRILFSGDSILEEVIADPASNIKSLVEHRASLEKILLLQVERVLPGHGSAFSNHGKRIRRILDRHNARSQKILGILEKSKEPQTPYSIALELFSPMKDLDVFYFVSSVLAHLEFLQTRGKIDRPAHPKLR